MKKRKTTTPERKFLPELSRQYGAKIYSFNNPRFPYFIEGLTLGEYGDEEGCAEDEIKGLVDYNTHDGVRPWAARILSRYDALRDEPDGEDGIAGLVEEIDWYLETMYGLNWDTYPGWLKEYLHDEEENIDAGPGAWKRVIDRIIPRLV